MLDRPKDCITKQIAKLAPLAAKSEAVEWGVDAEVVAGITEHFKRIKKRQAVMNLMKGLVNIVKASKNGGKKAGA